ncbi:MAG TPA: DUF4430 domain-containing protein [Oscillospiraceae bacterium]|nr:DUF4430 domain-containing protein [Oscillospiraceae bacterium]
MRNKLIACIIILSVLITAFYYGGNGPNLKGWKIEGDKLEEAIEIKPEAEIGIENNTEKGLEIYPEPKDIETKESTEEDNHSTDPVPENKSLTAESEDVEVADTEKTCTLSVVCHTILNNIDHLDSEKIELIPEHGIIYPAETVIFYENESVFNVLQREMKKAKIHMEFSNVPIYNSAYIEGINNIYEFDCGESSGWMYKVNGRFLNYGCSEYQLQKGDIIECVYTCDLGADIGRFNSGGD